ncbi:unnamed protein product [Schistocephalus solidus]|uniref:Growth hormone secretagogue receptor type 1 n=2 Tax=Schistocephalus solidus TaxID=70667 RepID=A0A183SH63_SCHSO|nr:unnamed protein product [Schistocephalus solidus]
MDTSTDNATNLCPNGNLDVLARNNGSDLLLYSRFAPPINQIVEKASYPLWCLIGFPGSILSMWIWSRRSMRRTGSPAAAVYQSALGGVDLVFFIVQLFWYLHMAWQLRTLDRAGVCEGFAIANYLIQYASPLLTLVFTVERYLAVCFPFKVGARNFGNSCRSAIHIVIGSLFFCGCLASVQGVFYTVTDGNCGLRPMFEISGTSEWLFYTVWIMFTEMLIFGMIPIICLILNLLVIRELHKLAKDDKELNREVYPQLINRQAITHSSARVSTTSSVFLPQLAAAISENTTRQSSTLTLLCVSFYLIFAHFSVAVMVLLYIILPMGDLCMTDDQIAHDPTWRRHFRFFTVRSLIESFGISHYAAKFYIYLATSAAFREQCSKLFHCCGHDTIDQLSNQDPSSGLRFSGLGNGGSTTISPLQPTMGSSTFRFGSSKLSVYVPSKRWSVSSFGSRNLYNDRKISYGGRQRPQAGISRTVLNEIGERVQIR